MMDDILKEQGFQQTGCVSKECIVEVGQLIGVEHIVGGSISKLGELYSVFARIVNVKTGEIIQMVNYDHKGDIEDLLRYGMVNITVDLTSRVLQTNKNEFTSES